MSLIIEVSLNGTKTLACYGITRITNRDENKPVGTTNTYEVRKAYDCGYGWGFKKSEEPVCHIEHNYDDPVEKIVELAMKKIQEEKK